MYSYVSYLSNDLDLKGVLLNNFKLRKYSSLIPYTCIVCEGVSEETVYKLESEGVNVVRFTLRDSLSELSPHSTEYLIGRHFFGKFLVFKLTDYQKCVYLDADILICQNLDQLFSLDVDCAMVNDVIMTPPHVCYVTNCYNSGVIVYRPNPAVFEAAIGTVKDLEQKGKPVELVITDQEIFDYLNLTGQLKIDTLPVEFNVYHYVTEYLERKGRRPAIIHYIGRPKPWDFLDLKVIGERCFESPACRGNYFKWLSAYVEYIESKMRQDSYILQPDAEILALKRNEGYIYFNEERTYTFQGQVVL